MSVSYDPRAAQIQTNKALRQLAQAAKPARKGLLSWLLGR